MTLEPVSPDVTATEDNNQKLTKRGGSKGNRKSSLSSLSSNKSRTHRKKSYLNMAPLNTPLQCRLETLGVMWHCCSIPFFVSLFLITISLGWIIWLFVILPYFIWWYLFDLHTPNNGKAVYRTQEWMRNLLVWEWFVNYFPIVVHKAVDLEPTFTQELIEDETGLNDEEDLVSENSRTYIDKLFKYLGLRKRLNDIDSHNVLDSSLGDNKRTSTFKYKKVATGPRYIFGYHPHGVISMGVMGTFATNILRNEPFTPPLSFLKPFFHDTSKGARLFPGIGNVFPLTLTTQFTLPFYRDYILGLGLTSASYKNAKSVINNGDNSVCIVVGGAQESLLNNMVSSSYKIGNGYNDNDLQEIENDPDQIAKEKAFKKVQDEKLAREKEVALQDSEPRDASDEVQPRRQIQLVLNKRKGFIKIAIETGNVSLVPTFGFGEADIFKLVQPKPGSLGSNFQKWMKSTFQFTVPFFSARGVFNYDFGLLPYRNPINICMGKPIHVPSGLIEEYKLKHPEFDSEETPSGKKGKADKNGKPKFPPEILNHYHKLYVDELKRIYEENKSKFGYDDVELLIIE